MGRGILDYTLVPLGLLIMAVYHSWLLRQIVRRPSATVVGINAINRRLWALSMMENPSKNGITAVQTIRNNIMASTLLASTAVMLSAAVTVMMIGGCGGRGGRPIQMVYGDISDLGFVLRFFFILMCFFLAFLFNIQSIKYYSDAGVLLGVPIKNMGLNCDQRAEYVCRMLNKGGYFCSIGLRAFYFAFSLFMWIFGPIPMFFCCVLMVFLMYYLDFANDFEGVFGDNYNGREDKTPQE